MYLLSIVYNEHISKGTWCEVIVSVCRAEKLFCVGAQSKAMDVSTGTSDSEEWILRDFAANNGKALEIAN